MSLKKAAEELLKIADEIEVQANEVTNFVCDKCNHTATLTKINEKRSAAASEADGDVTVSEVTINDRIACPACDDGVMSYVATEESEKFYVEEKTAEEEKPEEKTVLDVSFNQVPSLSLHLARLIREVKIQETVFELLTQQYEQYKIEENKDTPTVQVLDKAIPPERRARPKRAFLVVISGILSLFASVAFVFGQEYVKISRKRNPEGFNRMETLLGVWRKDVEDLRKKFSFRSRKKR